MAAPPACTVHYLPATWIALHAIARQFSETPTIAQQVALVSLFDALREVLPCPKCRPDFQRRLDMRALRTAAAGGREAVVAWMIDFHNAVNRDLGKPEATRADADANWARWSGAHSGCASCRDPEQGVKVEDRDAPASPDGLGALALGLLVVAIFITTFAVLANKPRE